MAIQRSLMNSASPGIVVAGQSAKWRGVLALLLGLLVVVGAGFAHPTALHNATHDTRHAFGLPCH